jgi:hypothetical protein
MAGHGLSDQYQQAALNYLTFAQSAATGARVGGRFNVPIMDKMGTTVSVNMDKDQLKGAMDSIKDVMQQYVDQGGRVTVGEYRDMKPETKKKLASAGVDQAPTPKVVPAGKVPVTSTAQLSVLQTITRAPTTGVFNGQYQCTTRRSNVRHSCKPRYPSHGFTDGTPPRSDVR